MELQQTQGKLQAVEVQLEAAHHQAAAMLLVQQGAHKKCTELEQHIEMMHVSSLTRRLQSCQNHICSRDPHVMHGVLNIKTTSMSAFSSHAQKKNTVSPWSNSSLYESCLV